VIRQPAAFVGHVNDPERFQYCSFHKNVSERAAKIR
jgi:hypothetical protein